MRSGHRHAERFSFLFRSTRFGDLLREHRLRRGFSQEHLAEKSRISVEAVGALERGTRRAPYWSTVRLLIAALGLNEEESVEFRAAVSQARARVQTSAKSGESESNNLPPQLTSFVDRENVLAEIKGLLQSHRLVTLVGTGGCGKTRCAIEAAGSILDGFSDGVWLAELASISDSSLIAGVIARTLGVQESPKQPILNTLLAYLKRKRLLLIVDNCEHVIDEAGHVVARILHGCPDVRILATSRESLNTAGEQVYRIPSLSQYGSVQLFTDRAISADNRFILSAGKAPHVIDICRRLDGIPLAIELAAARVKVLSTHELAKKLDERFRVLTGGDRNALPRHRTMRALIDWSYDLLSDDERRLFRELSIFAGSFTLESVVAVCSHGEVDEIVLLDLLSSLVDKSLVQAEVVGGDTRYRLLESTRQYAREKLHDAGEHQTIAHEHARAFLELAERIQDSWEITPDRAWLAQTEPELENFRAALSWALGPSGDAILGQRLAGTLRSAWTCFAVAEGRRWVQAAQQRVTSDTPPAIIAALDLSEAMFARSFTEYKASLAAAERAFARYEKLADVRGIADAELWIACARIVLGEIAEGEALAARGLEAARRLGSDRMVTFALQGLALARLCAGDFKGARQRLNEALITARALGAERSVTMLALGLAESEFRGGDTVAALRLTDEALAALPALGDAHQIAVARCNMAAYLVTLRRYDDARVAAREALAPALDTQSSMGLALWALQHLAAVAALRPSGDAPVIEDSRRAARILGYIDARVGVLEATGGYTEQQEYDAMIPALRNTLGEDVLAKLMAEGSIWSEDQAVEEAMLI